MINQKSFLESQREYYTMIANSDDMSGLLEVIAVKIGRQSVLRYFFDPIVIGFADRMKEK